MEAVIPADHVFQRPTSIPPPEEVCELPVEPASEPVSEPPPAPPMSPMSKSMYITCFSMVL